MKNAKLIHVSLLVTSLLVTGAAQAFCFLKNTNHNRRYDSYSYPVPPSGFVPQQYYSYPYSEALMNSLYEDRAPVISTGRQASGQYKRVWGSH